MEGKIVTRKKRVYSLVTKPESSPEYNFLLHLSVFFLFVIMINELFIISSAAILCFV